MLEHQKQVVAERDELNTRIEKLQEFISNNPTFKTLCNAEQNDLCGQIRSMTHYLRYLNSRIARF